MSHIQEFDQHRGAILGTWAGIEISIDQANRYAWHYSKRSVSKVVPQGLRWKLRLFADVHTKLLPFETLKETATDLLASLNDLFEVRHWMAHGFLMPQACGEMDWYLVKSEFAKDGDAPIEERRFTFDELLEFRRQLTELATRMAHYDYALRDKVGEHPLDD
jgi:hypothetical protein